MNQFDQYLRMSGHKLRREKTEVLQINVGKQCNQRCQHCHVDAGPDRKEIMSRETMDRILDWVEDSDVPIVDITGGAPEMSPQFRPAVERLKTMSTPRHVIDRCNLTILVQRGFEDMASFLAEYQVEIVASLPCYSAENVNAQRGDGVFKSSITALLRLNELGYGVDPGLRINLVYNPVGAFLPGPQAELEADYKRELLNQYGIVFNDLLTITNMPIARFESWLRQSNTYDSYMDLLINSFNPSTVDGLMCRNMLSVGWRGEVYDCDFNQMLSLQWRNGKLIFLWDLDPQSLSKQNIMTGNHCFGCTAGHGSSCKGAITEPAIQTV